MSGTVVAIRESVAGERRIALTPEIAKKLRSAAVQVVLEKDAGNAAFFPDGSFADVSIVATAAEALSKADVLLKGTAAFAGRNRAIARRQHRDRLSATARQR